MDGGPMIRAKSSIEAMRISRDQERALLSDIPAGEPPRADSPTPSDAGPGIHGKERNESPPAPLCDDTTSLRLDQTGQQVERVRNILQIAGFLCLCLLCWLIGGIVAERGIHLNGAGPSRAGWWLRQEGSERSRDAQPASGRERANEGRLAHDEGHRSTPVKWIPLVAEINGGGGNTPKT
jgi:hypothetical protein